MTRASHASRYAWPAAWTCIGLVAVGTVAPWFDSSHEHVEIPLAAVSFLGGTFFAVLGGLIASRTGNKIGWLYLGIIGLEGLAFVVSAYSDLGSARELPFEEVAEAFADPLFLSGLGMFVAIFLLFPTGTLASPRWRWVWWPYVVAVAVTFLGFLVQPDLPAGDLTGAAGGAEAATRNALGIEALRGVVGPVLLVAGSTIILAAVAGLLCLVVRFRGGSPEERQQIRWLLAVAVLAGIALVVTAVTGTMAENAEAAGGASQGVTIAANASFLLLVTSVVIGIPLATTIAILKYRLYELDVVIRKTVVFALLAGFVSVVYVGIVVALSRIVGEGSILLSIVATAIVAALFQPVRASAMRLADRLVYGNRAEPYEVLARFSDRVAETYAAEDVLPRMARVIGEGVGAREVEVWLVDGEGERLAAAWSAGDVAANPADATTVPITHDGARLGEIRVRKGLTEPITPTEDRLLHDLASQVGLVLQNVGLTDALERRVTDLALLERELVASRMRIVEAHDAERRRLERNIHDGAQQHLVALAVKLRLARSLADKDPGNAAEMLRTLAGETGRARSTLLDLASGIYPAVLEERGVAEALRHLGATDGTSLQVDADGLGRLPIETEAAVYFVCLEAMQNAMKYAGAARIDVRLWIADSTLAFEVRDDGHGFDPAIAESGSGLRNMRDRLSTFGGEVRIESTPGRGTTVSGGIPLPAGARS